MTIGSIARAALFAALVTLGCKKHPDPLHIDVAEFKSSKQLADTLQYLVGMTEPAVWEAMQRNGFDCRERRGIRVDRSTGELGSGKPDLHCWQSHRINLGLRRRWWTVVFGLDSGRVTDVRARIDLSGSGVTNGLRSPHGFSFASCGTSYLIHT